MPKGKLLNRIREELTEITRTREMSACMKTREDGACEMSFSSEAEIEVWPGEFEVLSHAPGACDLSRMEASGMFLFNHNRNLQLGRVDSCRIDADRTGRFAVQSALRSQTTFAAETWKDIDSGVLQNTSVGYRVLAYTESKRENGTTLYTVTKWQPSEISIVTVPADISTGVDRSENQQTQNAENKTMNPRYQKLYQSNRFLDANDGGGRGEGGAGGGGAPVVVPPVISVEAERATGATAERARAEAILAACDKYKAPEIATRAIKEGLDLSTVRELLLAHVEKGNVNIRQASSSLVGLTQGEARAFSFVKLIRAMSALPGENHVREAAKFELEVCGAAADAMKHRSAKGTVIPIDVLLQPMDPNFSGQGQRAAGLNISAGAIDGGTGTGGNVIANQLLASSFIEILRNRCLAMNLGTELTGLIGNFDIPKMTSSQFGGGWIGEDAEAPQTGLDFGLIPITPKTAAAYAYLTRKMLTQPSIGVEALTRMDIAKKMAQVIDLAAFYGTGEASDPTGIKETTGIHAVPFADVFPTFPELVEMETRISVDNADVPSMAYVANARFRGGAKTTLKFPTVVGAGGAVTQVASGGTIWEPGNSVNGYRAEISNQIVTGDLFFGNFADMILGLWGGLEIIVDPYTHSTKGGIIISAFQDIDVVLRRVASFAFGQKPTA